MRLINEALSFIVFTLLDVLDLVLCILYKALDFLIEAEWRPNEALAANILVSEEGESAKIVCFSATSSTLLLEDVSDTLYSRPSLLAEALNRVRLTLNLETSSFCGKVRNGTLRSGFVVEMLQGKIGGKRIHPVPRWSDCSCSTCTSWIHPSSFNSLFLNVDGAKGVKGTEDVLFIHGFISSSKFWTETVFPNLSSSAKSKFRLFAVDLLGFGRSPKPSDSLYTLQEHVEMIEKSVIEPYKVKKLHIVAHSLGCILALAIAVKHPESIKSLTLLAPPYFGKAEKGEEATQYVMRRVAPRLVWPPVVFGASIACWYEHISRTFCVVFSKHHRLWEFLVLLLTRNRIRQYLLEGYWCHTHNAAWHTLHNIICGTPKKLDRYLDTVRDDLKCQVTIYHGQDDELIPVECSHNVRSKIPRARVKVIEGKDHISIVVGREIAFARELEEIWRSSSSVA